MGGMPEPVMKGPILSRLDWFSRPANHANLRAALNDLRANPDWIAVGADPRYGILGPGEADHLRNEWLPQWPAHMNASAKVRDGLIDAAQKALALHRAIYALWVCPQNPKLPDIIVTVNPPPNIPRRKFVHLTIWTP